MCSHEFHANKRLKIILQTKKMLIKIQSGKETYHIPHSPILMKGAAIPKIPKEKRIGQKPP